MSMREKLHHQNADHKVKVETQHLENMSKAMNVAREYIILFLTYILYKMTRSFVTTIQKFTWPVTGVEKIRKDAKRGLQFKQSAHVQKIFWRRKLIAATVADPSDFITTHKCFKHPNYVLKPTVSLYCITHDEAIFVETEEKINVYGSDKAPFVYRQQFAHAHSLIAMPLPSFHKIAQDLGDPKVPVIWISSTGRCGSTLLSQVFAQLPGMMVIGEPDALTSLAFLRKSNRVGKREYEQLLPSAIRLLCKPDDRAGMICVKARPCCTAQVADVNKYFPYFHQIFVYRNSLKTVMSALSILSTEPIAVFVRYIVDSKVLSTILPCFRRALYHNFCYVLVKDPPRTPPKNLSSVGIFTTSWAANISSCLDMIDSNVPIVAILYEDLMKNTRKSCSVLFDHLDIRHEYIYAALEGFKIDSTRGTVGQSMVNLDSRRTIQQPFRVEADGILKKHGLPKLGERFEVPGMVDFDATKFSRMDSRDRFF